MMKRIGIIILMVSFMTMLYSHSCTAEEVETASDNYFVYDDGKNTIDGSNNFSKHGFFILNSDTKDGEYFILSQRSYELAPIDDANTTTTGGNVYSLNPESVTNLAYKMNTGNLLTSNKKRVKDSSWGVTLKTPTYSNFPKSIFDSYVNVHTWNTEKSGKVTAPYTITAKYCIFSKTEYETYILSKETDPTKVNANVAAYMKYNELVESNGNQRGRILFRTASPQNLYMFGFIADDNSTNTIAHEWACSFLKDREQQIKPVFYMRADFFKNIKLDVGTMGKNVKKLIVEKYSKNELKNIYSEAEMKEIGFPTGYEVSVIKTFNTEGNVLSGATSVSAQVIIKNNTISDLSLPFVFIALYDENNQLMKNSFVKVVNTIQAYNTSDTITIELSNLSGITEKHRVDVLVWTGFSVLQSICDPQ